MSTLPSSQEEVESFCRRLDEAAQDKGWPMVHVAELTRTTLSDLARIYLDGEPPKAGFLMDAASALEVSEEWLRTGRGEKRPQG